MSGSATAPMRRGWKSALLGMGAIASVPTIILIADDYLDRKNESQFRRHQRAKIELWKDDAEGLIQTTIDRLKLNVGKIASPGKETPSSKLHYHALIIRIYGKVHNYRSSYLLDEIF